ncbi:MAG: ammonia monooxygenase [Alphaproteobacteria bacterium]|nr:ammonia monooxygenase [Alphaproteobacteria bacterium]
MAQIGKKLRRLQGGLVAFMCPGCDEMHHVTVDGSRGWTLNGDADAPTFNPSVLVQGVRRFTDAEHARVMAGEEVEPEPRTCHSFVRDGQIQFLNDCTHQLAGQTVPLPDLGEPR